MPLFSVRVSPYLVVFDTKRKEKKEKKNRSARGEEKGRGERIRWEKEKKEKKDWREREGGRGLAFLYIHKLAKPSRAHATVARTQKTPATIEPDAKRLIKLITPPEPLEGIPMNMYVQNARWNPAKTKYMSGFFFDTQR